LGVRGGGERSGMRRWVRNWKGWKWEKTKKKKRRMRRREKK
jgi:hypothetical protein